VEAVGLTQAAQRQAPYKALQHSTGPTSSSKITFTVLTVCLLS
jgi:hypothetical protein